MNIRSPALSLVLLTAFATPILLAPTALAGHEYDQPVWFRWDTTELDVLVIGAEDPVLGAGILRAIAAWETGIAQLAPTWLADSLVVRTYIVGADAVPPAGFEPQDIEVFFVPQGFFALNPCAAFCFTGQICTSHAPITVLDVYAVAAHEFGHCLGLGHVFQHGVEYSPGFDIMGSGDVAGGACPSNLNARVLERVYGHLFGLPSGGTITMSSGAYFQSAC